MTAHAPQLPFGQPSLTTFCNNALSISTVPNIQWCFLQVKASHTLLLACISSVCSQVLSRCLLQILTGTAQLISYILFVAIMKCLRALAPPTPLMIPLGLRVCNLHPSCFFCRRIAPLLFFCCVVNLQPLLCARHTFVPSMFSISGPSFTVCLCVCVFMCCSYSSFTLRFTVCVKACSQKSLTAALWKTCVKRVTSCGGKVLCLYNIPFLLMNRYATSPALLSSPSRFG